MLICIAAYTTVPSLPMEVVCPIIPIGELRELLSEDSDIAHLGREMEVNIREALGISLKEVRAHYF
jgi:hypothetical protein